MRVIKYSFLLVSLILFLSGYIFSQQYTWPESVVYDSVNDRYLISNTGSGDIIAVPRDNPTNMSLFVLGTNSGWVSMKGIIIIGNTIWCACTFDASIGYKEALVGRDLNDGAITHTIDFPSGDFINDVTADASGNIYLSGNSVIYQVDPNTSPATITTLLTSTNAYNGLYFDDANNRLLFTDDSPSNGAQISAMDMSDNSTSVLFASPAGVEWCDGLTMDHLGNIYYSVWSTPNQVMRYNPNTEIVDEASTGFNGVPHAGAADIFYHDLSDVPGKVSTSMNSVGTLVVPNFGTGGNDFGWVDFIPFEDLPSIVLSTNSENSIPTEFQLHQNFPNPFNPNTTIFYDVSRESNVKIAVFDLLGREIVTLVNQIEPAGNRSVNWDGRDYTGNLVNAGVYIYQIEADAYIQTKKMILLK